MSRSILLPLAGLAAIVLYGTTRAAMPGPDLPDAPPVEERVTLAGPEQAAAPPPPPPAAPRLRSEVEAETTYRAERDTAAVGPDQAPNTPTP